MNIEINTKMKMNRMIKIKMYVGTDMDTERIGKRTWTRTRAWAQTWTQNQKHSRTWTSEFSVTLSGQL
jgi:hypothetical protein